METYGNYPVPPHPKGFKFPILGLKDKSFFIPNPYAPKGAGMNDTALRSISVHALLQTGTTLRCSLAGYSHGTWAVSKRNQ